MIIRSLIAFPFPRRYAQPIKAGLLTLGSNEAIPLPILKDEQWAHGLPLPITVAGPCWNFTSFPFNVYKIRKTTLMFSIQLVLIIQTYTKKKRKINMKCN